MANRSYGPVEAWIGFKIGINPSQLIRLSAGGGGNAWLHYKHPDSNIGTVIIHPDNLYWGKNKTMFECGFESSDFEMFHRGFCGKRPFPRDKKGKKLYSKGIDLENQSREKSSKLEKV